MEYGENHSEYEEQGKNNKEEEPNCFNMIPHFQVFRVGIHPLTFSVESNGEAYNFLPAEENEHEQKSSVV